MRDCKHTHTLYQWERTEKKKVLCEKRQGKKKCTETSHRSLQIEGLTELFKKKKKKSNPNKDKAINVLLACLQITENYSLNKDVEETKPSFLRTCAYSYEKTNISYAGLY